MFYFKCRRLEVAATSKTDRIGKLRTRARDNGERKWLPCHSLNPT